MPRDPLVNLYVRTPKRRGRDHRTRPSLANTMILLAAVGSLLLIALAKVYLEQRTFVMGTQWEAANKEFNETLKERENLRLDRERLTGGDYILPRAQRLGLQPAMPGQIHRMWQPEPITPSMVAANERP